MTVPTVLRITVPMVLHRAVPTVYEAPYQQSNFNFISPYQRCFVSLYQRSEAFLFSLHIGKATELLFFYWRDDFIFFFSRLVTGD